MDYTSEGFVSFWLGYLKSEELLEELMQEDYSDDGDKIFSDFSKFFKTGRYDEDFREARYFQNGINSIAEALDSFSYSGEFISDLIDKVNNEIVENYNVIILLYNFKYTGEIKEIPDEKYGFLKYIGFTRYDYSREAVHSEVLETLGEIPWEYETKVYNLSENKRKNLIKNIAKIKELHDLDCYL